MLVSAVVALLVAVLAAGCGEDAAAGMLVSWARSGGIAGLADSVSVRP